MTTVYVKKINESNMMFDSDEAGVIYEISEAFSFLHLVTNMIDDLEIICGTGEYI